MLQVNEAIEGSSQQNKMKYFTPWMKDESHWRWKQEKKRNTGMHLWIMKAEMSNDERWMTKMNDEWFCQSTLSFTH